MNLIFRQYLGIKQFAKQVDSLRVYRNEQVSENLLESLEATRLVIPRVRLRYPDPIARRMWIERNRKDPALICEPIEPDSPRWNSVIELQNALFSWHNHAAYDASPHPFNDPNSCAKEFIHNPEMTSFEPWQGMRFELGIGTDAKMYISSNVESYYSTWQVLLAAEVADVGVHFRVNLAETDIRNITLDAIREGKYPSTTPTLDVRSVEAINGFRNNQRSLDAVVFFAEECGRAFRNIIKDKGSGRFQLNKDQNDQLELACSKVAAQATHRSQTSTSELITLCQFLSAQWAEWTSDGRPFVADAYKAFLAEAVQMVKLVGGMTFDQVRSQVGHRGGYRELILDKIWPDWSNQEKNRVRITLKASIKSQGTIPIDDRDIDAFVDFLAEHGLESFFWRLHSFEEHAFRGNEFALEGMKSDLQGMAIAVEHVAEMLGGTGTQLYDKFKQLWRDPDVTNLLKRDETARLARQGRLLQDWPALKASIEVLRKEPGGNIAADLVIAHRIRGGVHTALPEENQFELEAQFVALMRAAFLTFSEVRKGKY